MYILILTITKYLSTYYDYYYYLPSAEPTDDSSALLSSESEREKSSEHSTKHSRQSTVAQMSHHQDLFSIEEPLNHT